MSDYFDHRKDSPAVRRATQAFSDALLDEILDDLRLAARGCGYALAVHGTRARDIDMLAAPWTVRPADKDELVDRLLGAINGKVGGAHLNKHKVRGKMVRAWSEKPHGRRAILIYLPGMCPEIDLSVMPRVEVEKGVK